MNISVIGLGKLGLCTAACFASKGNYVIGVDNNPKVLDCLGQKKSPIDENGIEELLIKSWPYFNLSSSIEKAVLNSDATLIIVPTPSDANGKFTNIYIESVLNQVGVALKKKDTFHVIDVVSTVMPESSEKVFKPLLESLSGKICGKDFGLVYNPEFIAIGSVVHDFLTPDMVLIGASDEKSAELIQNLYLSMCDNSPLIAKMSLINAEITKLTLNCFVTMKISFVNELASICQNIKGANIDIITDAVGMDSRVGKKYLKGGLGFGGPCFPRDNIAFQAFARQMEADAKLGSAVVTINNEVVDRLFEIIQQNTKKNGRVALLGLSYKPGTHIVEESQSIILAKRLIESGYQVNVHDPKALPNAKEILKGKVDYQEDPYECVKNANSIALLTEWAEYRKMDWNQVEKLAAGKSAFVLDSWRLLTPPVGNLRIIQLGVG